MKKMSVLLIALSILVSCSGITSAAVNKNTPSYGLNFPNEYSVTDITQSASIIAKCARNEYRIPGNIKITNHQQSAPIILHLMLKATDHINKGNKSLVEWDNYLAPETSKENIKPGKINKTEYIKLQDVIRKDMNKTGKAPGSIKTSLGELGYKNIVYMYSKVLDYYNKNGNLPESIEMTPWKSVEIDDIKVAASNVKKSIQKTHKLPKNTNIDCFSISMPQFLYLSTVAVLQIKNGSNSTIIVKNFGAPRNSKDHIKAGIIHRTEYLKIATNVQDVVAKYKRLPDYYKDCSLGSFIGYENMVFMYSKVLDYYNKNGNLPESIEMTPWPKLNV